MALTIPLQNDLPFFSMQVELENSTYGLEFRYNEASEAWFVSISTADGTPIVSGARLVVDWPLFGRYADDRLPPGILIAQDTTGARQDPGLEDLGTRTLLLYFTSEETG